MKRSADVESDAATTGALDLQSHRRQRRARTGEDDLPPQVVIRHVDVRQPVGGEDVRHALRLQANDCQHSAAVNTSHQLAALLHEAEPRLEVIAASGEEGSVLADAVAGDEVGLLVIHREIAQRSDNVDGRLGV